MIYLSNVFFKALLLIQLVYIHSYFHYFKFKNQPEFSAYKNRQEEYFNWLEYRRAYYIDLRSKKLYLNRTEVLKSPYIIINDENN